MTKDKAPPPEPERKSKTQEPSKPVTKPSSLVPELDPDEPDVEVESDLNQPSLGAPQPPQPKPKEPPKESKDD